MPELIPIDDPFAKKGLVPIDNPFANTSQANQALLDGPLFNATPEQASAVTSVLSPQDMEMEAATSYYDMKFGTNHTPEMVKAQIAFEYGDDATPQVANAMNKKAANQQVERIATLFGYLTPEAASRGKSVVEAFSRRMVAKAAVVPQMLKDRREALDRVAEQIGLPEGSGEVIAAQKRLIMPTPLMFAEKAATAIASAVPEEQMEKLADFAFEQSKISGEIQSEWMSGKPLEQSIQDGDWETAGKDLATAIAFESPNLAVQLGLARINPALSMTYMGAGAAAEKRAELGESDDLIRNAIQPYISGLLEVGTEKYIGTGRIIDRVAKKEVVEGAMKQIGVWALDFLGGAASEGSATLGGNILDKAFGDDVSVFQGVPMSMAVGGVMDAGVSVGATPWTLGDANRVRKQNTNEEIAEIVAQEPSVADDPEGQALMQEMGENPSEATVDAYNQHVQDKYTLEEQEALAILPEADETTTPEGEPLVLGEGFATPVEGGILRAREDAGVTTDEQAPDPWIGEDISAEEENINRYRSKLKSSLLTPVLSYVRDISPEVYQRLNRYEFDAHQRKRDYQLESEGFLREMIDLAKEDTQAFTSLDSALLNEDYAEAAKYISKESLDRVRAMLDSAADDMDSVGLNVARRDEYFPRRVKDYEGLKEELGSEIKGEIEQAISEQERKARDKGYTLSEEEKAKIVNSVIAGSYRPIGGRKPRSLKRRTMEEITPDLAQYYYDSAESLMLWINDASDIIEMRRFFGKDLKAEGNVVDINESIGDVVAEITERDNLTPEDQNKLIGALRARFGYRPTGRIASKYKSLVALTTLGQVQNAITQFGDATWSFYESGIGPTVAATAGKKAVKMEDLGIEEVAEEFRTPNGLSTAVNTLFKYTGLRRIDRLGKESLVNASLRQYQKEAQAGKFGRDRQDRLDVLFGDDKQSVIDDLKAGRTTDDVKYLLFSTLLDWQPITLSNMPAQYLKNPNGRVMYTLKTFTIKQLDNFRTRAVDNIIEGVQTGNTALAASGLGNLLRLAGLFYLANFPIDLIKDWLSGKDVDISDTMIDNFYKLVGVSRYSIEYATRGGRKPSKVIPDVIIPPLNFIDYPATDVQNIIKNISEGEDIDLMNLESWKMLPIVGRTMYWTVGKGEEKEEKRRNREQ